ncbi:hypothetical protein [Bdellovibrio sp. HCB2-146]|uniref:hypothetical protein n=1 Tax=Bdellovibrio sp. HCB2-146 TaxID=3394362 RepID=UPI0039BD8460
MKKFAPVMTLTVIAALFLNRGSETKTASNQVSLKNAVTKATPLEAKTLSSTVGEKVVLSEKSKIEVSRTPLQTISLLSQKVFLSDADKSDLKASLLDKNTQESILFGLKQQTMLKPSAFRQRMQLLDAVYEGLKFSDPEVQRSYLKLTAQILSQEMTPEIAGNAKMREQFFGDRVEMALAMSKLPGFTAKQQWILTQSPAAKKFFQRASQISELYEVSL